MMAKPMKTLELHYPMIQVLVSKFSFLKLIVIGNMYISLYMESYYGTKLSVTNTKFFTLTHRILQKPISKQNQHQNKLIRDLFRFLFSASVN